MWLGCRAGLVVGIADKVEETNAGGYMSLEYENVPESLWTVLQS